MIPQLTDYPRGMFKVYWEIIPFKNASIVRLYAYDTDELVEEQSIIGDKEGVYNHIAARMSVFTR